MSAPQWMKRMYPNSITNHTGHDIIVRPEDYPNKVDANGNVVMDGRDIILKPGETIYGVDGFYDTARNQWYKLVDFTSAVAQPEGRDPAITYDSPFFLSDYVKNKQEKEGGWYPQNTPPEGFRKKPEPNDLTQTRRPTDEELRASGESHDGEKDKKSADKEPSTPADTEDKDKDKETGLPGDGGHPSIPDATNTDNPGLSGEGKGAGDGNPAAPGTPDGNGEPSVPHLDDPPKKRPYNPFVDGLLDGLKGLWDKAKQASSPLILDLDGDGVETLGQDAGVFFDHDANGFAQLSGWVAPDDGLLVWDRNGNGQIDDGSELFGNNSLLENGQKAANGFAALAELDKNGDGVLDASDAAFAALRVWRDKNSDGKVGEGELLTLDELGIQSLCTSYTVQQVVDANGNALRQQGSFTYVNGSTGQMGDVWFTEDTARSLPTERVEVPEEIAALPDVMAFGNVYSLHQAMARDESGALRTLVEEFAWADGYLTVGLPAAA